MVEIKVKGVELSLKEAEELYNELKVLFDKPGNFKEITDFRKWTEPSPRTIKYPFGPGLYKVTC